jgi:transposase
MLAPVPYFEVVRQMKNAFDYRLRLVTHARQHGIKAAARAFRTTVPTVRKWLRRWEAQGLKGLRELSRAPHSCPHKITGEWARRVVELRRRLPTFGARRLQREWDLPLGHGAIERLWREHDLIPPRRRKYRNKQDLAAWKQTWALFQQISADTKDLDDIPPYWPQMRAYDLPAVTYFGSQHDRIPPAAHTYPSDVETVHRLIEDEFYDLETFRRRAEFLGKASLYQIYFNLARPNSHKGGRTPWEIIHQLAPRLPLQICLLPPVFLDYRLETMATTTPSHTQGRYHLPRLPYAPLGAGVCRGCEHPTFVRPERT